MTQEQSWGPNRYHARLMRLFWPLCDDLAAELRREISRERDLRRYRPTPSTGIVTGTYPRFDYWQQEDWRPSFAEARRTDFAVAAASYRTLDRIPQTAYPGLAERLAATVGEVSAFSDRRGYDAARIQASIERMRQHPEEVRALRDGTLLGAYYWNERGISGLADAITRTFHSSITSIGQGIALLAQAQVPGFPDAESFAAAVVAGGALDQLSLLAPPNMLGPMARDGRLFPVATTVVGDGRGGLRLSPELESLLTTERAAFGRWLAAQPQGVRLRGRGNSGQGCPMGHHGRTRRSGITALAEPFVERLAMTTAVPVPERSARGVAL